MRRRPAVVAAVLAAVVAVSLSGCGSDKAKPAAHPSATPYADVPSGVELTKPGSELDLAEPATIAWTPRQDMVATLKVSVDRIERTTFDKSFQGWQISSSLAATTPYFARATVTNVSDSDLGGLSVPLWGQDGGGTLVAAQPFDQRVFAPCHPDKLPAKLAPGQSTHLCFVYLISPGRDLASVTFQPQTQSTTGPTPTQLSPITWTGAVSTKVKPPAEPKSAKAKKKAAAKAKNAKKAKKGKKAHR